MPTDPFGREVDEDPLKSMGWTEGSGAPATAAPGTEVAEPPGEGTSHFSPPPSGPSGDSGFIGTIPDPPQYSPSSPPTIRVSRRGLRWGSVITTLVILGVIGAFAVPPIIDAIDAVDDATQPFRDAAKDRPANPDGPPSTPGGKDSGGKNSGLAEGSFFLRGNLAPALRRLQAQTKGPKLVFIRIDANRVDLQAASKNRVEYASAERGGTARVWSTGPRTGSLIAFPWSKVDPSAPRRIVQATTVKRGIKASRFDYMVMVETKFGIDWSAYLKGGQHFTANLSGTKVTKIG